MNLYDQMADAYELRDTLRQRFIDSVERGVPFDDVQQRMLDRTESMIAYVERQAAMRLRRMRPAEAR